MTYRTRSAALFERVTHIDKRLRRSSSKARNRGEDQRGEEGQIQRIKRRRENLHSHQARLSSVTPQLRSSEVM